MTVEPGVIVLLVVGFLGLIGTLAGLGAARLNRLETRLDEAEDYNNRLWEWARNHLDRYYRWRRADAPDPDPIPERRSHG